MSGTPGSGLTWGRYVAFAAPAAGLSFYLFFVQFYFLNFATDVLLLPPAISLLFGLSRIWDAVSDPLAGYWSDRTRSRWGRRRPWMLAGIPLLFATSWMVWSPPAGLGPEALVAWSAFALVAFYTALTVYSIPHLSLGAELSLDHHERSRVFGAYRMAFVAGMLLTFLAIERVRNAADPRAATTDLVLGAGLVVSVLLLATPVALRERSENRGRGARSPLGALRDVLRNPHARVVLGAYFVDGFGGGVLGVLAPFVALYVLKRPDLIAAVPAFFVVSGVLSIPVWVIASRRFGKRNVWMAALAGNGVCFAAMFPLGEGDLHLLVPLLVGAGISNACGGALAPSMLADTIDWDELRTSERKEGAYSAAWGFCLKVSIGLVVMIVGVVLQLAGFRPNVDQAPGADLAIRGLFAFVPLAASVGAILVLRRFRLDASEHARIRLALDAREAETRAGRPAGASGSRPRGHAERKSGG